MQLFFNSPYYWTQITDNQSGTAQPNVNGKKLAQINVLYPVNEKDQTKLIEYFMELSSRVENLQKEIYRLNLALKALVPSVLDKAFKSEW
jgi:restriction endonuclease S subunit